MMRQFWQLGTTMWIAGWISSTAWAHPGHGVEDPGWLHWLSSPLHMAEIGLAVLVPAAIAGWLARRMVGRKSLRSST